MHMTDDPSFAVVLWADPTVLIVVPLVTGEGKSFSESPLQLRANRLARSGLTPYSGKVARKVKVIFTFVSTNLRR